MGAKEHLTSWWLFVLIGIWLWYRAIKYDRVIALLLITLGVIQMISYAIYSGANPQQGGQTLFMTLWVQCLVLAVAVFVIVRSPQSKGDCNAHKLARLAAGANVLLFSIIFVVAMLYLFLTPHYFSANVKGQYAEWFMDGRPFLGNFTWLYAAGIFFPLIILFGYYQWSDPGVAAIIITVAFAMLAALSYYNAAAFASVWPYFAIAVAFVGWLTHAFVAPNDSCDSLNTTFLPRGPTMASSAA